MDTQNISQCPEVSVKCFLLSRFHSLSNRQDACEAKAEFSSGTGILPVLEKSAVFQLNRAKDGARVLYVSAIALKLAKTWQQTPQDLAAQLAATLEPLCSPNFAVKAAPAGFIELELTDAGLGFWLQHLAQTKLPVPESRILSPVVSADRLFPIQYSHARCCSLLRMAHRERLISIAQPDVATAPQIWSLLVPNPIPWLDSGDRLRLVHPAERSLISQLITVLDNLAPAIANCSREKPVNYLKLADNLSAAFQTFYSQCRIWGEVKIETPKLAQARLGLVLATQSLLGFILVNLLNSVAPLEL
ncbi:DALR anticodon-binding domain-containing protein [Microcoleus sp. herbarium7]|uniref:DALR anticodon-binding domain-containing protein n=1 Tax=Microcoleus sp. herbarium7 TaxID=3055435 RepID=UPI002FD3EF67